MFRIVRPKHTMIQNEQESEFHVIVGMSFPCGAGCRSQDIAPDDAALPPAASPSEALELHANLTSAIGPGAGAEVGTGPGSMLALGAQVTSVDNVTTGSSGTEDSESGSVIAATGGLRNGFGVVNLNMGGLMTLLAAALVGGVLAVILGCSFTSLWYLRRIQGALDGMEERMRKAQVEPCARPRLSPFSDVCGQGLSPVPLSPLSQQMVQSPLESVYSLGRTSGKTAPNPCKVSFPIPRVVH